MIKRQYKELPQPAIRFICRKCGEENAHPPESQQHLYVRRVELIESPEFGGRGAEDVSQLYDAVRDAINARMTFDRCGGAAARQGLMVLMGYEQILVLRRLAQYSEGDHHEEIYGVPVVRVAVPSYFRIVSNWVCGE